MQTYIQYNKKLRVIPSIHHRAPFSQLVHLTCFNQKWTPEIIAVELPDSFKESVTSILRQNVFSPLLIMQMPLTDSLTVAEVLSLNWADSIIEAIRWGLEKQIPIKFIDMEISEPVLLAERKPINWVEDSLILEEGLPAFLKRMSALNETTTLEPIDSQREQFMATQLQQLLRSGKRVLFVCGAAHWHRIRELLEQGFDSPPNSPQREKHQVIIVSGSNAIVSWTGEMPNIAWQYETFRRCGRVHTFSRERAFQQILSHIKARLDREEPTLSGRRLMAFFTFLNRLCQSKSMLTPNLSQLYQAAYSCGGEVLAHIVLEEAMKYPVQSIPGLPQLMNVHQRGGAVFGEIDGKQIQLVSRGAPLQLISLNARKKNHLSKDGVQNNSGAQNDGDSSRNAQSQKQSSESGKTYYHATAETIQHSRMMDLRARGLAKIKIEQKSVIPLQGVWRGTLAIRETLRKQASGRNRLFLQEPAPQVLLSRNLFEGFEPIIWIFDTDYERSPGYEPSEYKDYTTRYPAFPHYKLPEKKIDERRKRAYLGGVARFMPGTIPKHQKQRDRWLRTGNQKYVPQQSVWAADSPIYSGLTPEEKKHAFQFHEILLLAGIHYARQYLIYISDTSNLPSDLFRAIARRKRKRIVTLTLSAFSPENIEKLRVDELEEVSEKDYEEDFS